MSPKVALAAFPNPDQARLVFRAWERFLRDSELPAQVVREVIEHSWKRCYSAGVDPGRSRGAAPVPDEDLRKLQHEYRELFEASKPIMAQARDFLSESGSIMILTDPSGLILETEGDPATAEDASDICLMTGVNWSELSCGTNAIGTALSAQQPVQVHGAEHFCAGIKRWTCSSTVVRDPVDGKILAALDVSGLSKTFSRHVLALVVAAASRIEAQLMVREMELRYRLMEAGLGQHLFKVSPGGVIVFDRKGRLTNVDTRAQHSLAALGITPELKPDQRLDAFDREASTEIGKATLPEWLRPEWAEPVIQDGERLGTIVVLPEVLRHGTERRARQLERHVENLRGVLSEQHGFDRLIGNAPAFRNALGEAAKVASTEATVLLTGESGTGKDLVARAIHYASPRAEGPFVAINCAALPDTLIESELFGHERGAFTSADKLKRGRFEVAGGGTLFLDEIGELAPAVQAKLLRVLQERQYERVGGTVTLSADVRLIAATNADLDQMVAERKFRSDLYYRLKVFPVRMPSLRERIEDIPLLVQYFVEKYGQRMNKEIRATPTEVMNALAGYHWPGNIRELENFIERAVILSPGPDLHVPIAELKSSEAAGAQAFTTLEAAEREHIVRALQAAKWIIGGPSGAAAKLGMKRTTLQSKIQRLGISRPQ